MSKKPNKRIYTYLSGFLLSVGLLGGQIFALNTDQEGTRTIKNGLSLLLKSVQKGSSLDKLFNGNEVIEDLYSQALKISYDEENQTAKTSLQKLSAVAEGLSNANSKIKIGQQDIVNILFNSNSDFRTDYVTSLCIKKKNASCTIKSEEISKSYAIVGDNIEKCRKYGENSRDRKLCIHDEINKKYQSIKNGEEKINNLYSVAVGEDMFMNGSKEDSAYDLFFDVKVIGDILFESFAQSPEMLFYKLPSAKSKKNNQGSTSSPGNNNQGGLQSIPTNTNTNTTTTTGGNGGSTTGNTQGKNISTTSKNTPSTQSTEIANFIKSTTTTQTQKTNSLEIGNSCLQSIPAGDIVQQDTQETRTTGEIGSYTSGINEKITSIKYNPVLTTLPNIQPNPEGSGSENQLLEEQIKNLSDPESIETCRKKCEDLPIDTKVTCELECLCFVYSTPKYTEPALMSMNDMLKLRFCMVPVQKATMSKSKNSNGREDMLKRIKAVLTNLINGGEMAKYQKTKEVLDNPIADLKRSEFISFEIKMESKPIFSNKPKKALQQEAENARKKIEKSTANKEQSPGGDIDKYVIIQDINKNKATKKYTTDYNDLTKNYETVRSEQKALQEYKAEQIVSPKTENEKAILVNSMWVEFLDANRTFWYNVNTKLREFNALTNSMKNSPKFNQ